MTQPTSLAALLGQRVTVTGPNGSKWAGTLTALADQPTAVIDLPDGGRVSLPQSHTYTVAPRPEDELRGQLAAATARAEQAEAALAVLQQRFDEEHATAVTRARETDRARRELRTAEARVVALEAECEGLAEVGRNEERIWAAAADAVRAIATEHATGEQYWDANAVSIGEEILAALDGETGRTPERPEAGPSSATQQINSPARLDSAAVAAAWARFGETFATKPLTAIATLHDAITAQTGRCSTCHGEPRQKP
jgi:hypothetical protein